MITRTEVVREGEWFTDGTPDEWFAVHAESAARGYGEGHPDLTDAQKDIVRRISTPPPDGLFWVVCVNDYWHRLWTVGLYDGWVFWRKWVCVGTDGPIPGMHTHEGYDLRGASLAKSDPENHWHGWTFVDPPARGAR